MRPVPSLPDAAHAQYGGAADSGEGDAPPQQFYEAVMDSADDNGPAAAPTRRTSSGSVDLVSFFKGKQKTFDVGPWQCSACTFLNTPTGISGRPWTNEGHEGQREGQVARRFGPALPSLLFPSLPRSFMPVLMHSPAHFCLSPKRHHSPGASGLQHVQHAARQGQTTGCRKKARDSQSLCRCRAIQGRGARKPHAQGKARGHCGQH